MIAISVASSSTYSSGIFALSRRLIESVRLELVVQVEL
jgi:hypothetical protein